MDVIFIVQINTSQCFMIGQQPCWIIFPWTIHWCLYPSFTKEKKEYEQHSGSGRKMSRNIWKKVFFAAVWILTAATGFIYNLSWKKGALFVWRLLLGEPMRFLFAHCWILLPDSYLCGEEALRYWKKIYRQCSLQDLLVLCWEEQKKQLPI